MRIEEPGAMRELHEIGSKHYEETKHMTAEERSRTANEATRKIAEKYNLKFNFIEKKH